MGSKTKVIPHILEEMKKMDAKVVIDYFAGSLKVSIALKRAGYGVISNDINFYSYLFAKAIIEDPQKTDFARWNEMEGKDGWFVEKYSRQSWYFQERNAKKIQAIRDSLYVTNYHQIASLIIAADKVDSTVGIQSSFLKDWSPRSYNEMVMLPLPYIPGWGKAYRIDANRLMLPADVAYLDPPYNSTNYLAYYHVYETIAKWDNPKTYGLTNRRAEVKRSNKNFYDRKNANSTLLSLISKLQTKGVILSLSEDSFYDLDLVYSAIKKKFPISWIRRIDHPKNIQSQLIGKNAASTITEYLFCGRIK